jgi:hypothetical protein
VAKLIANRRLPFRRYWRQFDGTQEEYERSVLSGSAFCPNPESEYGKYLTVSLKPLDSLAESRCLVLLGQPGQGKTIEIDAWIDRRRQYGTEEYVVVRGSDLGSPDDLKDETVASSVWKSARHRNAEITLILDGLDEGHQRLPVLVNNLVVRLKREPLDKTRVFLISRVADWRKSQTEEFFNLWPTDSRGGVYELCPLTHADATLALRESGINPSRFLQTLHDLGALWMTARPKLLLMLIAEFQDKGTLPLSRRQLFEDAALRMCKELDEDRARRLRNVKTAPNQTYAVISRIAAAMLLSGKSRILCNDSEPVGNTDIPYSDLLGDCERVGGVIFDVDETRLWSALDTTHFVGRGPDRLGFDHQTMAEFMAADFLRRFTVQQLRTLVCQRLEGRDYLVPQHRELAAWLAVMKPEFCKFLIQTDPIFLLEADVVELDNETKVEALHALLKKMDCEEAFDEFGKGAFLRGLRHPFLAKQLRPYIVDGARNPVVRRTAIRIAGETKCRSLEEEFWKIIDKPAQVSVRNCAIHAISDLASAKSKPKFVKVLQCKPELDSDNALKGTAIEFLVPRYLPVSKVLRNLSPLNENILGGPYWRVLHSHLPNCITVRDVPHILLHLEKELKIFRPTGHLKEVADAALKLALRNFGQPSIRRALVRFWIRKARAYDTPSWVDMRPKGLSKKAERLLFRRFVTAVVQTRGTKVQDIWGLRFPPTGNDLGWILNEMCLARAREQKIWADLAAPLCCRPERIKHATLFRRAYRTSAIFRDRLPTPRRFDIETTLQRLSKASDLTDARRKRRQQREIAKQLRKPWVDRALTHLAAGEPRWWPELIRVIQARDPEDEAKGLLRDYHSHDITTSPGWRELSQSDRRLAIRIAEKFLCECPAPHRQPGKRYVYDDAAYHAVALLHSRVRKNIVLQKAIKAKWIPALLDESSNGTREDRERVALVYRLNRSECVQWFRKRLEAEDKSKASLGALDRFSKCWDPHLTTELATFAVAKNRRPISIIRTIAYLATRDRIAAYRIWLKLSKSCSNQHFNRRTRSVLLIGLFCFPERSWDLVLHRVKNCSRHAQMRFVAESAHALQSEIGEWDVRLTDRQVADWYLIVSNLFPPDRTRGYERGGSIRTRDYISDLHRACVNILVQRGTSSACAELLRISNSVPIDQRVWHRWHLNNAVQQRLKTEWSRDVPTPQMVLRMARESTALRIRDEAELQNGICQSLFRLQEEMHRGRYPKVVDLWNGNPGEPHVEKRLSMTIANWLERDLKSETGLVVDREVQIGWVGHSDIKVEVPANQKTRRARLIVIVEIKRCLHDLVRSACKTQLADGYLRRKKLTHGIYLVGWFDVPGRSKVTWTSIDDAAVDVKRWASDASDGGIHIKGFALDCRWVDMGAPSALGRLRTPASTAA